MLCKAPCKRRNIVGFYMLLFACTLFASCWELLHPFAHQLPRRTQSCMNIVGNCFLPFARSLKTKLKSNQNTLLGTHRQNSLQDIIVKPRANGGNIVGQQLLTLFDVTYCVHLHTLLHVIGKCCPKFETGLYALFTFK